MTAASTLYRYSGRLLLLCTLLVVFGTHVLTTFAPLRIRGATSPVQPSEGVAQVILPPSEASSVLPGPFALIARLQNQGPRAADFVVRVDGRTVCERAVGGGRTARVDCAAPGPWDPARALRVEVAGPADDSWTLTYLELATHHGSTRGYDMVVLPAGSTRYEGVTITGQLLTAVVLLGLLALPQARAPDTLRRLHVGLRIAAAALLLGVWVSNYISEYTIQLSLMSFWALVAVLEAPRVWFAGAWLWGAPQAWPRCLIGSVAAGLIVLAAYALVVQERVRTDYDGNYSGLLHLSRALFDRHPELGAREELRESLILMDHGGYDAQFNYYAVFDPFLRAYRERPAMYGEFIDAPPYRYGRIGFTLLTRAIAGSRWRLYPAVMTWAILASLFVCGAAFAVLAGEYRASPAWGMLMLLIPGFWQSAQVGLPEPLAAALLLSGYLSTLHRRFTAGAILFATSLLVRETGAVLVGAVAAGVWLSGRHHTAVRGLVIAIAPLVCWRLYVGVMLAPEWGTQAFWFNAQNLGMPFAGLVELWRTLLQGAYYPAAPEMGRAALSFSVLACLGFALAGAIAIRMRSPLAIAGAVYATMTVSLTFDSIWVHVGNAQRGTYELFVLLALLTLQRAHVARPLRLGLLAFWAAAALYIFHLAHDADFIRNVMPFDGSPELRGAAYPMLWSPSTA